MKALTRVKYLMVSLCALGLAQSALADTWWWKSPDRGFSIDAEASSGVSHNPGDLVRINGNIRWLHADSAGSKPAPTNILANLDVRFYFPDYTNEVTSQVSFNKNILKFTYDTPALNASDVNTLIVVVGRVSDKDKQLEKIKSKLDRRIAALQAIANDPAAADLASRLQLLSQRIGATVSSRFQTLARLEMPLQVGNGRAAATVHETLISGFLFNMTAQPGAAIEGERAKVKATITNFRKLLDFNDTESHGPQWVAKFSWPGMETKEIGPQTIATGASITHEFTSTKLVADGANELTAAIFKVEDDGSLQRFGTVTHDLQTASDEVAPTIVVTSPLSNMQYVKTMPQIKAGFTDSFGRIDRDSIAATLSGQLDNGATVNLDAISHLTVTGELFDSKVSVVGDLNPLFEGAYTFRLSGADLAGNEADGSPYLVSFRVDRTSPVISLGVQDHLLTRNANFEIPILVTDRSPTIVSVVHNGTNIFQGQVISQPVVAHLREGLNIFEITAVDAAGNEAAPISLYEIVLDSTPPVLSQLVPQSGQLLNSLSISVSGASNESLLSAKVNGSDLVLSEDKKHFSGIYTAQVEGPLTLHWEAVDLAGNIASTTSDVQVVLKVLNGDLLSVVPAAAGNYLIIKGAPGAARPGITVTASTGIFNSASTVASADGSFSLQMVPFTEATVKATDPQIARTDTATVTFGTKTMLSGTVKDTSGSPLPNATVTLAGSGLATVTDSSGVFTFAEPVTGDQVIIIDGSTVPQPLPPAPARKFFKTKVSVSIGLGQSSVIERPIYLHPIVMDGSATEVSANSSTIVIGPYAPGVEIRVPAGAAVFPDGKKSGLIAMATLAAEYSTVPPLSFSRPSEVVALEPSGLQFSEPVELTLPNINELPPGVEMVIMSMNSQKGVWEIDGIAKVSDDGRSVITKPGQGITHFSIVYASPIGPKVGVVGSADSPGADAFSGALTTSIVLPSFKSMGKSMAPSLKYSSSWALPKVLVTNILDIPREEINYRNRFYIDRSEYAVEDNVTSWYEPESVSAQFFTSNLTSEKVKFTGVPNKAVISYSLDLKDRETGEFFKSDVYPYLSRYEIQLKKMVLSTRKVIDDRWKQGLILAEASYSQSQTLDQIFPQDLAGLIYLQNHSKSPAGSGWRINGVQRIVNPSANRVLIEESDGAMSAYALSESISTLFNASGSNYDLARGVDLNSWPLAYFTDTVSTGLPSVNFGAVTSTSSGLWQLDLSRAGEQPSKISSMFDMRGYIASRFMWNGDCYWTYTSYSFPSRPNQLLAFPDGRMFGTDEQRHIVFQGTSSDSSPLVGALNPPVTANGDLTGTPAGYCGYSGQNPYGVAYVPGIQCADSMLSTFIDCGTRTPSQCLSMDPWKWTYPSGRPGLSQSQCYSLPGSTGLMPTVGFTGDGALENALNKPMGIAAGPRADTLVVADTGNNRVRLIDLAARTISTIAGNGQNFDVGDGQLATAASIFHPRGVVYDSFGNLYISSENGFVRKVDTSGRISTVAGARVEDGATVGDRLPATKALLSKPYGMAVDNARQYLYIAEQGAHLVRRLELNTGILVTVAGNGSSGFNGDGKSALNASLSSPSNVGLDSNGNLLIVDAGNQRIRRVAFQNVTTGALGFASSLGDNTSLSRNEDGSWTRRYRNGLEVYFNSSGLQIGTADRAGRTTAAGYDNLGRLISFTDATGQAILYGYSGDKLASITDPAGRTTSFQYDGSYLRAVHYPDGSGTWFEYNSDGLLSAEINARGKRTEYEFNQWGRIAAVKRADGNYITINDSGSATASNNFTGGNVGRLTKYGLGQQDVVDGIRDARQVETKFVKDTFGFITTIVDGNNQITKVERDSRGQPLKVTRPDGTTITYSYDPDTRDLISQADSALGATRTFVYDVFGNVTSEKNARGHTSTSTYDANTGLLLTQKNPLGFGSSYSYTALGLVAVTQNSLGKVTSFTYDSASNLASATDPAGKITTYVRDAAGNILSLKNPKNQTTTYEYDLWNRVTAVITPKGERTEYSYMPTGELSQIKDPLGNVTTFEYDDLGRIFKKVEPTGYAYVRKYDENSNLTEELDPNGIRKEFHYNALNQLIEKVLPDDRAIFEYDVKGQLKLAQNSISKVQFGYDVAGRLNVAQTSGLGALVSMPAVTLTYEYDANGNRTQVSGPGGINYYGYDAADRLISVLNHKNESFGFGYDSVSRLTSMSRPGGQSVLTFDDRNFVSSIIHSAGAATLATYQYTVDEIGNRTQSITQAGTFQFGYDSNNQLSSATHPENAAGAVSGRSPASYSSESFEYDALGNRKTDQGGAYAYDEKSQRLTEDYRNFYFYDNNGNLISKQEKGLGGEVTNFMYSSENQLIGFKLYLPGNNDPVKEVAYDYDALGRRIQKRVIDHRAEGDVTKTYSRRFVYDRDDILLEYDGQNNLLARYTHSLLVEDDVLAVDVTSAGKDQGLAQAAGSYMYLKDGLGSVVDIATPTGTKIQHFIYSAFGVLLGIQDANAADITTAPKLNTSYSFTGRERDSESGLYYYRARYYDPNIGRFLQRDPHPGLQTLPMTIHSAYSYAGNNPVNYTDPSGKFFFVPILVAIAYAAIVGAVVGAAINAMIAYGMGARGGRLWLAIGEGAKSGAMIGAATTGAGAMLGLLGVPAAMASALGAMGGAAYGGYSGYQAGKQFGSNGALAFGLYGALMGAIGGYLGVGGGYNAATGAVAGSAGAAMEAPIDPPAVVPDDNATFIYGKQYYYFPNFNSDVPTMCGPGGCMYYPESQWGTAPGSGTKGSGPSQ